MRSRNDGETGSGVAEEDPARAAADWTFSYTPFGEVLHSSGNAQDFDHRFNAKQTDLRSGIFYYGYRYYDPLTLTWLRADPLFRFVPDLDLTNPRAMNLFSFSLNNPLRYVDPDGLQTAPEDMPDKGANWTVEPWDGSNSYVVKVRDVILSPVHAPGGWKYVYSIVSYDNKVIPVFTPIITGWSKWFLKHHIIMSPDTKKAIDGAMIVASVVIAGISSGIAAARAFEEGASTAAGKAVAGEVASGEGNFFSRIVLKFRRSGPTNSYELPGGGPDAARVQTVRELLEGKGLGRFSRIKLPKGSGYSVDDMMDMTVGELDQLITNSSGPVVRAAKRIRKVARQAQRLVEKGGDL